MNSQPNSKLPHYINQDPIERYSYQFMKKSHATVPTFYSSRIQTTFIMYPDDKDTDKCCKNLKIEVIFHKSYLQRYRQLLEKIEMVFQKIYFQRYR